MPTVVKLGPADHGRILTVEEFESGDYEPGYKYELISGSLYVSPSPNAPEDSIVCWVCDLLKEYSRRRPDVINHVTQRGRIFIPDDEDATRPEPDVSAFHDYPSHLPRGERDWRKFTPLVVVEVLSSDPEKDLERNVDLYLRNPSIREYWVFDIREDADRPTFRAYRRRGTRWVIRDVPFGERYSTHHLVDFELLVDPDA